MKPLIRIRDSLSLLGPIPYLDNIRPKNVAAAVAKLKKQYGAKFGIYPLQVDNAPKGKIVALEIVKIFGETHPIYLNKTSTGRYENRRATTIIE